MNTPTLTITSADGHAAATISYSEHVDPVDDGRTRYHWTLSYDGHGLAHGDDLRSGCTGGNLVDGLRSLVSFLGAFDEAMTSRHPERSENADLFPADAVPVAEYAEEFALDVDDLT